MMPGAWAPHAATLFNEHPTIDIGVHLTLTSEWDAVKWRPLTQAPSLTDENGYFRPLLTPRPGDGRSALTNVDWSLKEIAAEFRAQISAAVAMFAQVSHVSAHMCRHFRDIDPRLGAIIADLCVEFGLKDDAFGHGLARFQPYPPHPRGGAARAQAFVDALAGLPPGTHIVIDHPAVRSRALEATGHPGYEDVAADREGCLAAWTDPAVQAEIAAQGIALIGYGDL